MEKASRNLDKRVWAILALPILLLLFPASLLAQASSTNPPGGFRAPEKSKTFSSAELLARFEAGEEKEYDLGEGDELTVEVWDHQELSGKHIVGPDGKVTLPLAGALSLAGLSREEATAAVRQALSRYYLDLALTLRVDKYNSHRVFILGRVSNPGALFFDIAPTLLEAIARAGGLPVGGAGAEKAALARCAIFRGRDKVVWVELKSLLNGTNLALNLRLKRNDVVYLPDSDDQLVYVLGEVRAPGAFRLTPNMSFLDALSLAGGPTKDAAESKLHIVRQGQEMEREFSFKELLQPGSKLNYSLNEGDIIFLPRRGLAKTGYVMERLNPFASFLLLFSTLAK